MVENIYGKYPNTVVNLGVYLPLCVARAVWVTMNHHF